MEKFWLICYDVSDPKRLRLTAKVLKQYGVRVQKSVFECALSPAQFKTVKREIGSIIDLETDSVRYYPLCKTCMQLLEKQGNTDHYKPDDYIII